MCSDIAAPGVFEVFVEACNKRQVRCVAIIAVVFTVFDECIA
jgi:selenophosphate synthase